MSAASVAEVPDQHLRITTADLFYERRRSKSRHDSTSELRLYALAPPAVVGAFFKPLLAPRASERTTRAHLLSPEDRLPRGARQPDRRTAPPSSPSRATMSRRVESPRRASRQGQRASCR